MSKNIDGKFIEGFKNIINFSLEKTKENIEEESKKRKTPKSRKISFNEYTSLFKDNYKKILTDLIDKADIEKIQSSEAINLSLFVFTDNYETLKQNKSKRRIRGIVIEDLYNTISLSEIFNPNLWKINNCFSIQVNKNNRCPIEWNKREKGECDSLLITNLFKNEPFIGHKIDDTEYLKDVYRTRILWFNEVIVKMPDNLPKFKINIFVTEKKIKTFTDDKKSTLLANKIIKRRLQQIKLAETRQDINNISTCYYENQGKIRYGNRYEENGKNRTAYNETRIEYKCRCEKNSKKCSQIKDYYKNNFCNNGKQYSKVKEWKDSRFNFTIYGSEIDQKPRKLQCEEKVDLMIFGDIVPIYPLKIDENEVIKSLKCQKDGDNKGKKILNAIFNPLLNVKNILKRRFSFTLLISVGKFIYDNKDIIINIVSVIKPIISWFTTEKKERDKNIKMIISSPKSIFIMNEMLQSKGKGNKYITISKYTNLIYDIYKKTKKERKKLSIVISSKNLPNIKKNIKTALSKNKVIIYFNSEDFININNLVKVIYKSVEIIFKIKIPNTIKQNIAKKKNKAMLIAYPIVWNSEKPKKITQGKLDPLIFSGSLATS